MYSYHREYERIERSQMNNSTDGVLYRNTCYVTDCCKKLLSGPYKEGKKEHHARSNHNLNYTVTMATCSIP